MFGKESTEPGDDGTLRSSARKAQQAQSVVGGQREQRRPRKAQCLAQGHTAAS